MSKTLDQIFIANPAASLVSTDLIYLSRSPYTPGNDFGITAANFIASTVSGAVLLAPAGDQTITAHNLTVSQGNLQAGSSGHAGTVTSFPGTAANGALILAAVNAGAAHNTTISNSTMAQASVVSIPDPGAATANFAVAPSALVIGNLVKASSTTGLLVDAGVPAASVIGWAANANASISAAVGHGYILTSGSATTVTLPTVFAVGTMIGVAGQGAAWTVDIGGGTNVIVEGNTFTTSIASANNSDSIVLLATVANTTWTPISMITTGFTAS